MSKTTIYVLKLTNNKYYVGKTNDLERRKQEHLNGTASTWTKKYKPIEIEKIIKNASSFDEDKYTLEFMDKYGVDNVRGGQYATEALDELQRYNIKKSLWANNDCCYQCGRKGHFIHTCKFTTDINGENILSEDDKIEKTIKIQKDNSKINIKTCYECLQEGHYASECPKKKETFNCQYCDKEFETQKGATCHENKYCKSKYEVEEEIFSCQYCDKEFETQKGATYHENKYCKSKYEVEEETFNCQYCDREFETQKGATFHENVHCQEKFKTSKTNKTNKCYRCGRNGHYSGDCYASTHVRGHDLD